MRDVLNVPDFREQGYECKLVIPINKITSVVAYKTKSAADPIKKADEALEDVVLVYAKDDIPLIATISSAERFNLLNINILINFKKEDLMLVYPEGVKVSIQKM